MNGLRGQNLPIMNAVAVSLTLHVLVGWAFLNIAREMTNLRVVPPVEFFVIPPPPEHVIPPAPRVVPIPAPKNVTPTRIRQVAPLMPAAPSKPVSAPAVAPSLPKQRIEAAQPPSPVPPIAASSQVKGQSPLHSVPATAAAITAPAATGSPAVSRSAATRNYDTGTVAEQSYEAAYLYSPPPPYPYAAKKLKLQGTVIVRVLMSREGLPKKVVLEKTSGVRVLDETTVEWVMKNYKFKPAPHEFLVNVPVEYKLK